MPDRIVRDELLRSHRYRTLSSDTSRLLFFHLLLSIDNLGNIEANSTAIGDVMRRHLDDATVSKLLSELADADLIRLYAVDKKLYLHVPRFRQRLRYLGAKHPRPAPEIECSEISKLCEEFGLKPGEVPVKARSKTREEKRSEEKRSEVNLPKVVPTPTVTRATPAEPEGDKSPVKGNTGKQWWRSDEGIAAKAEELCEQARPGETFVDLKRRLFDVIAARERTAPA